MSKHKQVELLRKSVEEWNEWRKKNLNIMADLSGADLRKAKLLGAFLRRAVLRRANLTGANLSKADLTDANFTYADLTGAKLTKAKLSGANLKEANLTGADLRGADLRGAWVEKTNFTRANLSGAIFRNEYDLSLADLRETDLSSVIFDKKDSEKRPSSAKDGELLSSLSISFDEQKEKEAMIAGAKSQGAGDGGFLATVGLAAIAYLALKEPDSVFLGASAPGRVQPGNEFTATFAAYLGRFRDEVEKKLKGIAPRSKTHMDLKECQWKKGAEVTVVCQAKHVKVEQPEQKLIWSGKWDLLHFDMSVYEDAPEETVVLKFDVYISDISVAKLRLDLDICGKDSVYELHTREISCKAAESAFASYSSQDRKRVLDRVASLQTSTTMDIFMDCYSLKPNDEWRKKLEKEIPSRELFLLFWSKHAKESPWVEWEWKYALQEKGEEPLQVHPLDPVKDAPPPEELKHIHFNDPLMLIRSAEK